MSNVSNVVQEEVVITRVLKVGAIGFVAPSEAFQGIELGRVTINNILSPEDMDAPTKRDTVDLWLGMVDEDDVETRGAYSTAKYVQYTYSTGTEDTVWSPIDIFADHWVPNY
jgi:hypothetical protein